MKLTEDLIVKIVKEINGSLKLYYQKKEIDFTPPYQVIDYRQALLDYTGIDLDNEDIKSLKEKAEKMKIKTEISWGKGKIIDEIYKENVRPKITNPTFLINHPIELSPLAKQIPDRPDYVERFQLLVSGLEVCNAFSELNNPFEQEKRFLEQQNLLEKGDQEAQPFDQDFIDALKQGMPPTAGEGIGIDRLTTILTDKKNIKEVILFPTLKPKAEK
jgi:lysyl-tRNA synthetase class 2